MPLVFAAGASSGTVPIEVDPARAESSTIYLVARAGQRVSVALRGVAGVAPSLSITDRTCGRVGVPANSHDQNLSIAVSIR